MCDLKTQLSALIQQFRPDVNWLDNTFDPYILQDISAQVYWKVVFLPVNSFDPSGGNTEKTVSLNQADLARWLCSQLHCSVCADIGGRQPFSPWYIAPVWFKLSGYLLGFIYYISWNCELNRSSISWWNEPVLYVWVTSILNKQTLSKAGCQMDRLY